jgi:pimeloyl-ACP methyl ester carboxylesterase
LTPFEIYWTFREFWYERWKPISIEGIEIIHEKIVIDLKNEKKRKILSAIVLKSSNQELVREKNAVIIIVHGFSDTKESLQKYYLPFARLGYIILTYDARGTGKSKKAGRRSQFLNRITDFKKIVNWVKENKDLSEKRLFSVGFSIGAVSILCGSFSDERVEKIIAISAMSNYRKNLPKYNLLVMFSYFIKGVKLFPKKELNQKLSPSLHAIEIKNRITSENWKELTGRILFIHSRNDRIIKMINFYENVKTFELPDENSIILSKGGHNHKKNEMVLVGSSIKFLESN